jgi:WhiB family redox-sensing transcriptional regulator
MANQVVWEKALCRSHAHPDWWFGDASHEALTVRAAVRVCLRCPIRLECLSYALDTDEPFGVWGGATPAERARVTWRPQAA